jgi:hypothetical protein
MDSFAKYVSYSAAVTSRGSPVSDPDFLAFRELMVLVIDINLRHRRERSLDRRAARGYSSP